MSSHYLVPILSSKDFTIIIQNANPLRMIYLIVYPCIIFV